MTDKAPKRTNPGDFKSGLTGGVKNALAMPPKLHAKKHALAKLGPVSSPPPKADPKI